jgi:hypothetical protein
MSLFWITFLVITLLGTVVVFATDTGRRAPRLLVVLVVAFGIAFAMPEGKYPLDSKAWLGVLIAIGGIIAYVVLEYRETKPSNETGPSDDTEAN